MDAKAIFYSIMTSSGYLAANEALMKLLCNFLRAITTTTSFGNGLTKRLQDKRIIMKFALMSKHRLTQISLILQETVEGFSASQDHITFLIKASAVKSSSMMS